MPSAFSLLLFHQEIIHLAFSSGSNLRDFTPVPPPRRKKKNRGRPLPPKPNEVTKSHVDRVTIKCSKDSRNSSHEPLYSSVNFPNNWSNDKEIFEHKVQFFFPKLFGRVSVFYFSLSNNIFAVILCKKPLRLHTGSL